MAKKSEKAPGRKPYTNPAVEGATLKIEASLEEAYDSLLRYVKDELATLRRDGQLIERDAQNLARIQSMVNQLQARARELGFNDALAEQTAQAERLLKAIEQEGQHLGVQGKVDGDLVDQLLLGGTRAIVREELQAAGVIEQILIHDAFGVPWGELVLKLKNELHIRKMQAVVKATSSIASFHTQMRVDYFREGGIEWYLYNGPDDERTREWCGHFVGLRVTPDILDEHPDDWKRKYPLRPSVGLGGYNCRHELVPILPENVDRYSEGPR